MNKIDFEIMRGSTGLGIFKKLNNLGEKLNPPNYIEERNNLIINKIFQKIFLKKSYQHDNRSNKSFLIKPNKIKK